MRTIAGLLILSVMNVAHAQSADFAAANERFKTCLSSADSSVGSVLNQWLSLESARTAGRIEPKSWEEFAQIDRIREQLVSVSSSEAMKNALTGCAEQGRERARLLPAELAALPPRLTEFSVIGRGMIASYVQNVEKVNQALPAELRVVTDVVLPDPKKAQLLADGVATVSRIEKVYEDSLFATSGFADREALMNSMKTMWPDAMPFAQRVLDDDIDFAMARPENGRFWMPKTGFQNQYVTGSSRGSYDPNHRLNVETKLGRFPDRASYEPLDKDFKPKYGYAFDRQNPKSSGYGPDIYLFKKDRVEKRVTLTVEDSFAFMSSSYDKNWLGGFVPWKFRELALPWLAKHYSLTPIPPRASSPSSSSSYYYSSYSMPDLAGNGWKAYYDGGSSYVELQFWGPLTLDDVDSFLFTGSPPTGDFLDELTKRGIKIYKMNRRAGSSSYDSYSSSSSSPPAKMQPAFELVEWKPELK